MDCERLRAIVDEAVPWLRPLWAGKLERLPVVPGLHSLRFPRPRLVRRGPHAVRSGAGPNPEGGAVPRLVGRGRRDRGRILLADRRDAAFRQLLLAAGGARAHAVLR